MQNFSHRATRYIRTFLRQTAISQIATSMFGIGHVHVADDVHNASIGLFGQAFVFAAVARFHVENRNVQALCGDGRKTTVGIAEDQQCIWLASDHELVAAIDDVSNGCTEVVTYGIHIYFRILETQVLEEHAVKVIIVILASVRKNAIKILAALVNDSRKTDNLWARAYDNQKFQLTIIGKFHIAIICLYVHFSQFTTFSPKVSGWFGSKDSFAHITVTRFSVCERLMMLWV